MPVFLGDRCCYYTWGRWEQSRRHQLSLAVASRVGWLSSNTDACSAGLNSWSWQGQSGRLPVKVGLKSPGPSQAGYQARKSFLRIPRLWSSSAWCWDFSLETGRRQGSVSHQWFLSGFDTKDLTRALIKMTCCHQDGYRFFSCFMLAFFFFFFHYSATLLNMFLSQISALFSDTWIIFFPFAKSCQLLGNPSLTLGL